VLDWTDRAQAHGAAQDALLRVEGPGALLHGVRQREPSGEHVARSVEKTTHFKWFVAEDADRAFKVWLHEYKPASQRRTGHATVAHNHRFWFTLSLLVQSAPVRSYSDVFEGGRMTRYHDLPAQFEAFVESSAELPEFPAVRRRF
jgi:hypothetical protein